MGFTVDQDVSSKISQLLAQHGHLPVGIDTISRRDDLYAAGLKSFAVVQVMLALEGAFDIEFPDKMLVRRTFASLANIEESVQELIGTKVDG